MNIIFPIFSKKIISFSLWGTNKKYINGAFENIKLAKIYYPDWICRFYINSEYLYSELKDKDAEIVMINSSDSLHSNGLIWRFLPMLDGLVETFIVRDTDSRITDREKTIVNEWLESKCVLHIIRDHPCHKWNNILGGMWGFNKLYNTNIELYDIFEKLLDKYKDKNYIDNFGNDQEMLDKFVAHCADKKENNIYIHDEITDRQIGKIVKHKLPKRINYEFIGAPYDENNKQEQDSINKLIEKSFLTG